MNVSDPPNKTSKSSTLSQTPNQVETEKDKDESKAQSLKDDAKSDFKDGSYESAFDEISKITKQYPNTKVAASMPTFKAELINSLKNITASDLYRTYSKNEVNADNAYKDKDIVVSGTVKEIGKDVLNNIYVALNDGSSYHITSIQCFFDKDQSEIIGKLSKGNTVKIIGTCSGKNINVQLTDCYLIQ